MRTQAAFHSALLMCVPESQKPMHASTVRPPPPGALGADSLGLAEPLALLCVVVPPVANWDCSWGDRGAICPCGVMGVPITEAGGPEAACEAPAFAPAPLPPPPVVPDVLPPPVVPDEPERPADGLVAAADGAGELMVVAALEEAAVPPPCPPPRASAGAVETRRRHAMVAGERRQAFAIVETFALALRHG